MKLFVWHKFDDGYDVYDSPGIAFAIAPDLASAEDMVTAKIRESTNRHISHWGAVTEYPLDSPIAGACEGYKP